MRQPNTDWAESTVKLPRILHKITDASNNKDYIAAMSAVVEMRNELQILKMWYMEEIYDMDTDA